VGSGDAGAVGHRQVPARRAHAGTAPRRTAVQPGRYAQRGIFAEHAALAIEFARAREDHQRLAVLEDRDRIARDLHDLVVQRLFAISLGVQSLARLAGPGVIADRATGFVTDLDRTVREIRRSIFSLHEIPEGAVSLRGDLLRVVKEAAGMLGFRPRVDLLGALDSLVPDDVRPDLLAAVREALSNVARHAAASAVWVEVEVGQRRWPAAPARQG
jgi:signal transduction histidine kinase